MSPFSQRKLRATSLNATAYRIFKLLQWLTEGPLSVEELNQRFLGDLAIGRAMSEDSIWLYLNTLKKLGCEITRPLAANGHRYCLRYHPFGNGYSQQDIQTLIDAKRFAEGELAYPDILHLDRFFKKVLLCSSSPDIMQTIESVFYFSRSRDYEQQLDTLEALHAALQRDDLLFLHYQSPVNGLERFYFLPDDLFYKRGVMYLSGARLGMNRLLMLRVDRIERFECTEQPALYAQMTRLRRQKTLVRLLFYGKNPLEPCEQAALGGHVRLRDDVSPPGWEVTLETRELFTLRQVLLQLGRPFCILEPDAFRASLHQTLCAILRRYPEDAS